MSTKYISTIQTEYMSRYVVRVKRALIRREVPTSSDASRSNGLTIHVKDKYTLQEQCSSTVTLPSAIWLLSAHR